jgi:F-type H+-transporting ATPase subunit a
VSADALVLAESCHFLSDEHCGFPAPTQEIFHWEPIFSIGPLDVTKPVLLAFVSVLIVVGFFWAAFGSPKLVPRGVQNVGEVGYLFIRDQIARSVIGKQGDRFVPLLVSVFFFVWIMNLMSIIPFAQFPVTSRIAFPAGLALVVWLVYMGLGIRSQGPVGFFKNMMFPPGLPKVIYVILAPIELMSTVIVRPFTLAVRLFANMFAGHLLITTFSVAAWYLLSPSLGVLFATASFVMSIVLTAFELLIQALQAFIFTLLTAVYISGALEAEH